MSISNKSNSQASPQKKIKWYTQVFNVKWLTDTRLKDWLQQDGDNKNYSYCKCCKITLKNANKSMLLRHNRNDTKGAIKLQNLLVAFLVFFAKKNCAEDEQIAKNELLLAGYFAEHHIPFSHADHLLTVCKRAFPDSHIATKLSMKRTKISYVMQDCIAFHEKLEVTNICIESKFSIMIDENTDISVT